MPKSRKLEELLNALEQIEANPDTEAGIATLTRILASRQSLAIARAAKLVGKAGLTALETPLAEAFTRLLQNPTETDPGCLGKNEIAQALYRLEAHTNDVFLPGIRHIQMEPVWGGKEDRAAKLRGICALGLVRANYTYAMVELADLLADRESEARIGAARAIAYSGDPNGVPLLRLRLKIGDDPAVVQEAVMALLKLAPESSLPLARDLLRGAETTAEAVALALGDSRLLEAWPLLRDWWDPVKSPELRRSGLLAMALLRLDPALDFLIELIATGSPTDALEAITALRIYQANQGLWQRVCETVTQRGDQRLLQEITN
jgi:HEAT repeat protein